MSNRTKLDEILGQLHSHVTEHGVRVRQLILENDPATDAPTDRSIGRIMEQDLRDMIVVGYSDEDKAWVAVPLSIIGVSGIGDTPSLAIEQLLLALWGVSNYGE
jgi:hypothetical protein